ncbi:unnamed protein product [Protopolystoma xenopodis]|uniref:Uncharacterized protein n=1 Tax=Protopolystoma xenopodis TaxID=117903 RepID=A0A3S5A6Z5_9PLAT|nr:unnamed protein product [Protopolystoma xenopodis]
MRIFLFPHILGQAMNLEDLLYSVEPRLGLPPEHLVSCDLSLIVIMGQGHPDDHLNFDMHSEDHISLDRSSLLAASLEAALHNASWLRKIQVFNFYLLQNVCFSLFIVSFY